MSKSIFRAPLRPILVAAVVATLLLAGAGVAHGDACRKVKGKFVSTPSWPCSSPVFFCTAGTLTGGLRGTYAFTMNTSTPAGDPTVPGVMFYTGVSVITLDDGTVITGTDTGVVDLAEDGTRRMAALLTFTAGASGHLVLRGKIDFATFTVSGRYAGEICE